MPDKFKKIRTSLESERIRLTEELEQLAMTTQSADERREGSPFGKREEEATETSELEKRLALEKRLREQLADVEHSLQKFQLGTYGHCDKCGQPIAPDRLEALPTASLCMKCKESMGKNSKGRPSP